MQTPPTVFLPILNTTALQPLTLRSTLSVGHLTTPWKAVLSPTTSNHYEPNSCWSLSYSTYSSGSSRAERINLGIATPETLDTLSEIAAALGNDPNYFTTIADQVSELNTDVTDVVAALGIAENDSDVGTFTSPTLPDGTTLRSVLETFAGSYDTTKTNLEDADTALSNRLDTLEADPTTQTIVVCCT